mmetsp:Transcript_35336/g.104775  ORF Transcript_35336/g.104775 Transcript_35336/m.104775 type:complete len:480 (-) Transcript_35336:3-1442(-)
MALLPSVLLRHPRLALAGLPIILGLDAAKSALHAALTDAFEEHRKAEKRADSRLARVVAYDLAQAAQLTATGSLELARERWGEVALQAQAEERCKHVINALRNWIGWLYWQDVLHPSIEVGIAWLLEAGHVGVSEIWLYSRVIEDSIDTLLTRSRAEAQLASVRRNSDELVALHAAVAEAQAAARVRCSFGDEHGGDTSATVRVRCEFTRGASRVVVGSGGESVELRPSVYALFGPNGSGKSSLLALLSSCARGGALPAGLALAGECDVQLRLSADDIVEVTQRLYCPLSCQPVRWLAPSAHRNTSLAPLAARAAALLTELHFWSRRDDGAAAGGGTEGGEGRREEEESLAAELMAEHEDYCGALSGGQRAKLELVRSVLLRPVCPRLLLLDEFFAPLSAWSKALVAGRLRAACPDSVVVVVYHPDSMPEAGEGEAADALCDLAGGAFFDAFMEVRDGKLLPPKPCQAAARIDSEAQAK